MRRAAVVGIDLGGTNTLLGIVDREGRLLSDIKLPTRSYPEIEDFVAALYQQAQDMAFTLGVELKGVGVGAPCGNYYTGTIEFAPNLPWKGVIPLGALLQAKFGLPVRVTNDANAAAEGELRYGKAVGKKNFIEITLGTGLGAGIVIDGKVVYGADGFAGELGHVIVEKNGRQCGCGLRGCLETYVSATGVVKTFQEKIKNGAKTNGVGAPLAVTARSIALAAEKGDELAVEVMRYTGQILGEALASFVAFSAPEMIVLFGGLAKAGKLLLEPTKIHMDQNLLRIWRGKIDLVISGLDENQAAILGAAALAWGA